MSNIRAIRRALQSAGAAGGLLFALGFPCSPFCLAQSPQDAPPGVVAVPHTPPPTGPQTPVPAPALPGHAADKPLRDSPNPAALQGRVPAHPLTLQDAVALALSTNRNLELAAESLLLAQGRTSETRAALNPTLGAALTDTQLSQGSSATFSGQTIVLVPANQRQVAIQATLPIDILGLLHAATDQAKFQEIAARLDINRARNQVVLDVKTAFYNVLRQQALVVVATENLADYQTRMTDAQIKYKAGVVAYYDVIRAQTDVATGQQLLIQARSNVSIAIAALNNTIGIDVNTPLAISDQGAVENPPGVAPPSTAPPPDAAADVAPPANQPPPTAPLKPPVTYDSLNLGPAYDALVAEAMRLRPDILEADANIAAARLGIKLAYRSQAPTLGLSAGFNYTPDATGFAPQITSGQAVVSLNIPFYDGGVSKARRTEAKATVATAETNRRQAIDQVQLELRQAYLMLIQARDRVAVANQSLAEAREGFRLAQVRYNAGVSSMAGISPLLELSDAQAALTLAESNQVNALYDYNNGRATLDKAVGRYAFLMSGAGYNAPPSLKSVGAPDLGPHK